MNKKWALFLLIISSSCLFMSGCVKGVVDITIAKDGSADVIYDIAVDSAILSITSNPLEEIKQIVEKDGYSVSQYKDEGYIGITAKKKVNNVQEVLSGDFIVQLLGGTENQSKSSNISIDKGFFYDSYKIDSKINLTEEEEESDWINTMFSAQEDLKLKLTLPVEAEKHNASRVELKENKSGTITYVWDIIPNQNNALQFEARAYNFVNIILSILGGLILVILSIYYIRKKSLLPHYKSKN